MLRFSGAVAAQLLKNGVATHYGLKPCPEIIQREPLVRRRNADGSIVHPRVLYLNPDGNISHLKAPVGWATPAPGVWDEILACEFNSDCLALAAAVVGQLVIQVRPSRSNLTSYTDFAPCRESSRHRDLTWKAVPGMTKETASYWRTRRKADLDKAKRWFWEMLKSHGFESRHDPDEAIALGTQQRPDLSRVLEGKTIPINRHDPGFTREAPHYSLKRGRHRAGTQTATGS